MGAVLMSAAASASAAVVVVRSSGPSATQYPTGKSLAESARLVLRPGDTVVLLDGKGSRTLRGPGTFAAAAAGKGQSAASFTALMASANGRRGRVGAVRPPPQPRQMWQASADMSETFCYVQPGGVLIRRENIAEPRTITVRDLGSGKSAEVKFGAAQQIAVWPAAVPISNGGRYKVGNAESTMKQIPGANGFAELGSALIANGCSTQLDVLTVTAARVE